MLRPSATGADHMLDLIYLTVGLGSFALMAGYLSLCRKL
jgi:hypothetical protein